MAQGEVREEEQILVAAPVPDQVPGFGTLGVSDSTEAVLVKHDWCGFWACHF